MEASTNSTINSSILFRLRKSVETTLNQKSLPGGLMPEQREVLAKVPAGELVAVEESSSAVSKTTGKYLPYMVSQFDKLLRAETIDIENLRKISWNGIPSHYRPEVWKMLVGYVPLKRERREETLKRKRAEYLDSLPLYFSTTQSVDRTTVEGEIRRQILVDLPRTCPNNPFFHQLRVRQSMERILYIWSIRHPASGYVQGMNDLLTPLLIVCAQAFTPDPSRTDFSALASCIMVSALNLFFFLRLNVVIELSSSLYHYRIQ